jgi:hypothetical protein
MLVLLTVAPLNGKDIDIAVSTENFVAAASLLQDSPGCLRFKVADGTEPQHWGLNRVDFLKWKKSLHT